MADGIVRISPDDTKGAAEAIDEHGCVILVGAVPTKPLDVLRRRMDRDTHTLLRYCETIGGNPRETGHLQQGPPPFADYVFPEVAMNPAVNAVSRAVYGERPRLTFYNGNTNCPGSVRQRLHMDGRHSTQPGEPVSPTSSMVVNIPTGPAHDANGAIELWPGSHRVAVFDSNGVPERMEEERRVVRGPVNPHTKPGDVLLRDVRLWHRGVPNPSDCPRHMIALILTKPWSESRHRLKFGMGCERALEGHDADPNAEYVDGPIDYLFHETRRILVGHVRARRQSGEQGSKIGAERNRC
ncbi:MAG: phytanoyl-CoA dioxygenase family protein [Gammaproteobacteria bacterium]|nr:phytanoyl-CoA dioxygenase family protein [Gammaproteobacteria bacterium]